MPSHWLTAGSTDPLGGSLAPTAEASSASLLFAHKRPERPRGTPVKSVGPEFGKKRLGLLENEVDDGAQGKRSLSCVETPASASS